MQMTRRERLAEAVAGNETDRAPVALWRHFPVDDADAEQLALSVLAFQQQYDWDFIKLTPLSNYSIADWGGTVAYHGHPEGTSDYITPPLITVATDWERLQPLNVYAGAMGQQLDCIRRLRELAGPDIPIIETVFNPLSQVKRLVAKGAEIVHLRRYPQQVRAALEVITTTTIDFVTAAWKLAQTGSSMPFSMPVPICSVWTNIGSTCSRWICAFWKLLATVRLICCICTAFTPTLIW